MLNPNLRVFDIVMETEFGTSYNAYIIKGEKNVLVETCHRTFFEPFLANIREVCPVESISYIVVNHTEPDHSGSLDRLLELCPEAEVVCSQAAAIYLKNIANRSDMRLRVVKDGDVLELGKDRLRFINAPFLHWPDSQFAYLENEKVLFTCDFLGAHYCEPLMLDTAVTYERSYEKALHYYYQAIFGPFAPYVRKGLDKIEGLDFHMACVSHGPVLTREGKLNDAIAKYAEWCRPHVNEQKTIPIFFCTAYGNTELIAEKIKVGIVEILPDAKVELYNVIEHDMGQLAQQLNLSDAFLIGTPTINKDAVPPVWQLLSHLDAINNQKKPCGVFGSFGWSGEAVPAVCSRLQLLKLRVFGEGLKITFVPNDEEQQKAVDFGREFAKTL